MAQAGAIKAGQAYVEVFADKSPLVRGLNSISRDLTAWGKSIQMVGLKIFGAGTAASAALFGATKYFSVFGDNIAKMSQRTGVSVEALSELSFVASQSGVEFETLENGIRKMQRSIVDAGQGSKTAVDTLKELGLTFSDLKTLSPEAQIKLLADKIAGVANPTKKAAIAMDLFGKTGTALLPMFKDGAAGIEKLQQEARKLGLTLSSEDAKSAEALNDALDKMWRTIKMGYAQIGAALAPAITDLSERIAIVIGNISKWIKEHRGLIKAVAYASVALMAGGAALMAFGATVSFVGALVGKIAVVLKLIGSVVGAIVSPIGLVITAVAGLAAAILYYTGAGGKAVEWLQQRFYSLGREMKLAVEGISSAFMKGDIGLAAQIFWLTLKMEFLKGYQSVLGVWVQLKGELQKNWFTLAYAIAAIWDSTVYKIKAVWIETVSILQSSWIVAASGFATAWIDAVSQIKSIWSSFAGWYKKSVNGMAWVLSRALINTYAVFEKGSRFEIERIRKERIAQADANFAEANKDVNDEVANSKSKIDSDSQQRKRVIQDDAAKAIVNADQARLKASREAKSEYDTNMEANANALSIILDEIEQSSSDRLKAAAAELEKVRQAWLAAIAEAKKTSVDGSPNIPKYEVPDMDLISQKYSVAGTFSGLAAQGLGGGTMDRIARATEETARNTRPLKDQSVPTFKA